MKPRRLLLFQENWPLSQEHPKKTLVVHVVQNAAGPDPGQNMAQIERLLAGLSRCDLVALIPQSKQECLGFPMRPPNYKLVS